MSAWQITRSFGQEAITPARRDLAIAVLSWLAMLAWISALIGDAFR